MGVSFADRGKILEEQIAVMRGLWTEESVTYHGKFHTLNAVGINPLADPAPDPAMAGRPVQGGAAAAGRAAG